MNETTNNWGGSRDGAGRPIIGTEKRDRNIGIRVSESELELIKAKAEASGKKLTQFIIDCILESK